MSVIAIYMRLSSADDSRTDSKCESNSIKSQRKLIQSFIKDSNKFSGYHIEEYIDDGYTGTNSNRPELLRMLDDAKCGKINVIIVKDFSRFYRNYIEAGEYIECVFPFLGIRFISVNDMFDSDTVECTAGNIDVVLKNIIADLYSKDLSFKVSQSYERIAQKGGFTGAVPPFGYIRIEDGSNKLIFDPDSIGIVRRIYDEILLGYTMNQIAERFNSEGIPTPSEYQAMTNKRRLKTEYADKKQSWTRRKVRTLVINPVYKGDIVVYKRSAKRMYSMNTPNKFTVENAHKGIVSKEEFEEVQKMIIIVPKRIRKKKKGTI